MIVTDNFKFDILAIISSLLVVLIAYLKWNLNYWKNMGMPGLNPGLLFGDARDFLLGRLTRGEQFKVFYNNFKSRGYKYGGVFVGPKKHYVPIDPNTIKAIMQTDFSHFMNHGNFHDEKADPLSAHLFNLEDTKWRKMRVHLTPTFTSGKMKMMFQTMADCAVGLDEIMQKAADTRTPLDIKDILGRFTTDIIGAAAFGLECNSLKDPNAEFRKYGKTFFEFTLLERMKLVMMLALPQTILQIIGFRRTNADVEKFFMNAIRQTVDYREQNNIYKKDFMHLLLQLKNRGVVKDDNRVIDENEKAQEKALTFNELAAQAFVFFVAGFETSSTLMTWTLYELAINPDVQDKLRTEINKVLAKHNGQISYDAIMEMTYLEKVLYEALRKYPPVPVLSRKCTKDYRIPDTDYILKKGTTVQIPILALHTDPEYYPNPEKFDLNRFNKEEKQKRPSFTWIPFGEGPRLCIGLRFGLMQSKVGLLTLLRNYKIKINRKTSCPVKLDPTSFIMSAKGGIWLDVEKLQSL